MSLNPNITRNLIISASRYTSIQACFFRTHLHYNLGLTALHKAEPLERGSLIDKLCNVYYTNLKLGKGITESINEAVEQGRAYGTAGNLDIGKVELYIERFIQYVHHYLNDDWKILGVQEPFTKIIYENEEDNLRIIAEGLVDLIVSARSNVIIVDTKSSAREADIRKTNAQKLDNQFALYCTVFGVNQVYVNDIGVQKSKNEDALFKRRILNYTKPRLEEWMRNVVYWCNSWLEHHESELYPMNNSSCYGCEFNQICSEEPEYRGLIISRDYKINKTKYNIYGVKESKVEVEKVK